jgi:hypothetical protein
MESVANRHNHCARRPATTSQWRCLVVTVVSPASQARVRCYGGSGTRSALAVWPPAACNARSSQKLLCDGLFCHHCSGFGGSLANLERMRVRSASLQLHDRGARTMACLCDAQMPKKSSRGRLNTMRRPIHGRSSLMQAASRRDTTFPKFFPARGFWPNACNISTDETGGTVESTPRLLANSASTPVACSTRLSRMLRFDDGRAGRRSMSAQRLVRP